MSATVTNPQFIEIFSQVIRAQVNNLSDDQKKNLFESILSGLTPTSSPASSDEMPDAVTPDEINSVDVDILARRKAIRAKAHRARKITLSTNKKPVNAFMTFRAFYSPLLIGLTQKIRSGLLSKMWRAERRQSLFHLLGAAYSLIRDDPHHAGVSLEKFLKVASGAISVIPVREYLFKAGWAMIGHELIPVPVNEAAVNAEYPPTTNASPEDIIEYCYQLGLLVRSQSHTSANQATAAGQAAMSFAAQPQAVAAHTGTPVSSLEIPNLDELDASNNALGVSTGAHSTDTVAAELNQEYGPSMSSVIADQQLAYDQTAAAVHWHPDISPPVLGFDPNLVQDDFDPFNFELDDFFKFDV